jgi:hypothetical protein
MAVIIGLKAVHMSARFYNWTSNESLQFLSLNINFLSNRTRNDHFAYLKRNCISRPLLLILEIVCLGRRAASATIFLSMR